MNTSQLLLVSSLGLAVNLFGMFAMGGHHHVVQFLPIIQCLILTFSDRGDILILMATHILKKTVTTMVMITPPIPTTLILIPPTNPWSMPTRTHIHLLRLSPRPYMAVQILILTRTLRKQCMFHHPLPPTTITRLHNLIPTPTLQRKITTHIPTLLPITQVAMVMAMPLQPNVTSVGRLFKYTQFLLERMAPSLPQSLRSPPVYRMLDSP